MSEYTPGIPSGVEVQADALLPSTTRDNAISHKRHGPNPHMGWSFKTRHHLVSIVREMSVYRRSADSETAVVELRSRQEHWAGIAVTSVAMMYLKIEFLSTSFSDKSSKPFS